VVLRAFVNEGDDLPPGSVASSPSPDRPGRVRLSTGLGHV